ncbi:MAG: FAD-dependent oxidoreductase [Acidimicrobiales bacterium]
MADPLTPLDRSDVGTFDSETDVLVAGFGAAGTCAAYAARHDDAEVLVMERASGAGGAAGLAEGIVYLGAGTPVQKACGFEDSVDNMTRYLMAACGPEPDEAKVVAYAESSLEHFAWLVDRGIEYDARLDLATQMAPAGTEGLVWSGGENAWPFNEIATPAPRGHLAKTKRSTGWLLMQKLAEAAVAAGAEVSYDTRIERLVVDDGRVIGAVATRYGERVVVRARRGVVLSAGGFIWNDDMLRRHAPTLLLGTWKVGTEADDGRAIEMAQAVGARVKNMHAGEVSLPIIPPRHLIEGIIVDGAGQRFINEDTYMGRVGQAALYERDATCFLVIDEAGYEPNWMGLEASWVCETVGELESEMGLPPGSLDATLALYNRHAQGHDDPVFHKHPEHVRPLVAPLGAFDLRRGAAPYAPFTLGGLETTVAGEVVGLSGTTVPGLFAAGRTTAGICSFGYASGLSLGDSTLFGRFAGAAAARAPATG